MRTSTVIAFIVGGCSFQSSSPSTPLHLDNAGLGTLGDATPWSVDTLRTVFPDTQITRVPVESEGVVTADALVVRRDGHELVRLTRARGEAQIASIVVATPDIPGPHGETVGMTFAAYKAQGVANCVPGMEEASGQVLCSRTDAPRIAYVFDGEWEGPDGVLPPEAVVAGYHLAQMVWRTVP